MKTGWWCVACWLLAGGLALAADDFAARRADRAAVERIYYNHRTGAKPPFEQVLPVAALDDLVRQELKKEAVLKKVYQVEITPAQIEAEVQRIHTSTRAPEVLAELKAALGNDPVRFARAVAKPNVVEKTLRDRFNNDDALHAAQRRAVEQARAELLAAKQTGATPGQLSERLKAEHPGEVSEATWELTPRPGAGTAAATPDEIELKKRFGPDAKILSSPGTTRDRKFYFEELPKDLQTVLKAQLHQAGDISAVIEMPTGFLLYVTREKTMERLGVTSFSKRKQSYDAWVEAQQP